MDMFYYRLLYCLLVILRLKNDFFLLWRLVKLPSSAPLPRFCVTSGPLVEPVSALQRGLFLWRLLRRRFSPRPAVSGRQGRDIRDGPVARSASRRDGPEVRMKLSKFLCHFLFRRQTKLITPKISCQHRITVSRLERSAMCSSLIWKSKTSRFCFC